MTAGPNLFAWVVSQGACASADTIEIYVSHAAVVDAGSDESFCGRTFQLSGSSPGNGSGLWTSITAGVSFSNASQSNAMATNLSTGSNLISWTVNDVGCTASDTLELTVLPGADADFSYTQNDLQVSFTDLSQNAQAVGWEFGDNNYSNQASPTHTYAAPGTYLVCLVAMDSCGDDTTCESIVVTCGAPTAGFDFQTIGMQVDFTDTSNSAATITDWHWDFGDGDTSNVQNPSHNYQFPGSYQVCLEVEDACGDDSFCQVVDLNVVGVDQALEGDFSLWPQPAADKAHLSLTGHAGEPVSFQLFDLEGRVLMKHEETPDNDRWEIQFEVGDLPAGMYLLQVSGPGYARVLRFSKI